MENNKKGENDMTKREAIASFIADFQNGMIHGFMEGFYYCTAIYIVFEIIKRSYRKAK